MSNDKTDADIAFVRALAEILNQNDLGEIEVEREFGEGDELKVRLTRTAPAIVQTAPVVATTSAPVAAAPSAVSATTPAPLEIDAATPDAGTVPSPMVGTVYLAPEPGAANFIKVGDTVTKGQTILIIEAMKTMNQIPAPHSGTVTSVLVDDAEPVEFGSALMTIA